MLPLLAQLAEKWDEHIYKRAVDQHHGRKVESNSKPPVESDLTGYKPYQMLIKAYPKLERQLKLAWNGDAKALAKGEKESDYIFPKLLKVDNLEKFDDRVVINQETMRCVKELYDLFCAKFKIVNRERSDWLVR